MLSPNIVQNVTELIKIIGELIPLILPATVSLFAFIKGFTWLKNELWSA